MALKAGFAEADITPPAGLFLSGAYGTVREATGVHDPLMVSALHLRGSAKGVLFISLDLMFLSPPWSHYIRRAVASHTGTREDYIILGCTLNHSGPLCIRQTIWHSEEQDAVELTQYLEMVKDRAVAVAARACAATRPSAVVWAGVNVRGIAVNRFAPHEPVDVEQGVLSVLDITSGKPIAAVVISGIPASAAGSEATLVSADYVHYLRSSLRQRFGGDFAVVTLASPCADIAPAFREDAGFNAAERAGRYLGEAVADEISRIQKENYSDDIHMSAKCTTVDLSPMKTPSMWDAKVAWGGCRAALESAEEKGCKGLELAAARGAVLSAEGLIALAGVIVRGEIDAVWPAYRTAEVQVVRIHDGYVACVPGEFCASHALEIKRNCSMRVFVAGCINGEQQGWLGYAGTGGGVVTVGANSLHDPGSAALVVNSVKELMAETGAGRDLSVFRRDVAAMAEKDIEQNKPGDKRFPSAGASL